MDEAFTPGLLNFTFLSSHSFPIPIPSDLQMNDSTFAALPDLSDSPLLRELMVYTNPNLTDLGDLSTLRRLEALQVRTRL
jgi:hypothetical protein